MWFWRLRQSFQLRDFWTCSSSSPKCYRYDCTENKNHLTTNRATEPWSGLIVANLSSDKFIKFWYECMYVLRVYAEYSICSHEFVQIANFGLRAYSVNPSNYVWPEKSIQMHIINSSALFWVSHIVLRSNAWILPQENDGWRMADERISMSRQLLTSYRPESRMIFPFMLHSVNHEVSYCYMYVGIQEQIKKRYAK